MMYLFITGSGLCLWLAFHWLANVELFHLCSVSAEGVSCSNCPGLELTSSLEMGKLLILLAWFDWQIYFHNSFISALTISCIGSLSCLWSFPQFSSLFLLVYFHASRVSTVWKFLYSSAMWNASTSMRALTALYRDEGCVESLVQELHPENNIWPKFLVKFCLGRWVGHFCQSSNCLPQLG